MYNMLGETEKSSDVCRTASLSEMGHEQRAAASSTVMAQRQKNIVIIFEQNKLTVTFNKMITSGKSD